MARRQIALIGCVLAAAVAFGATGNVSAAGIACGVADIDSRSAAVARAGGAFVGTVTAVDTSMGTRQLSVHVDESIHGVAVGAVAKVVDTGASVPGTGGPDQMEVLAGTQAGFVLDRLGAASWVGDGCDVMVPDDLRTAVAGVDAVAANPPAIGYLAMASFQAHVVAINRSGAVVARGRWAAYGPPEAVSACPGGRRLVVALPRRNDGVVELRMVDARTLRMQRLVAPLRSSRGIHGLLCVDDAPRSVVAAVEDAASCGAAPCVTFVRVRGRTLDRLRRGPADPASIELTPRYIYFSEGALRSSLRRVDLRTGVTQVVRNCAGPIADVASSPDGQLVAAACTPTIVVGTPTANVLLVVNARNRRADVLQRGLGTAGPQHLQWHSLDQLHYVYGIGPASFVVRVRMRPLATIGIPARVQWTPETVSSGFGEALLAVHPPGAGVPGAPNGGALERIDVRSGAAALLAHPYPGHVLAYVPLTGAGAAAGSDGSLHRLPALFL